MNLKEQILGDASASYWLKGAIVALDKRDPLDALRDAEVLVMVLKDRWNNLVTEATQ